MFLQSLSKKFMKVKKVFVILRCIYDVLTCYIRTLIFCAGLFFNCFRRDTHLVLSSCLVHLVKSIQCLNTEHKGGGGRGRGASGCDSH